MMFRMMKLFVAIAVLFCVCSPAAGQLEVTVQKSDFNRAVQEPYRFEQLISRQNFNDGEASLREASKKVSLLVARSLREGRG